jgi:hypothetical protein
LWSEKRPKAEKYIKARADDGLNSEKRAMEMDHLYRGIREEPNNF